MESTKTDIFPEENQRCKGFLKAYGGRKCNIRAGVYTGDNSKYVGPFCNHHNKCTGKVKRRVCVGYNAKGMIYKLKDQACGELETGGTGKCWKHGGIRGYRAIL